MAVGLCLGQGERDKEEFCVQASSQQQQSPIHSLNTTSTVTTGTQKQIGSIAQPLVPLLLDSYSGLWSFLTVIRSIGPILLDVLVKCANYAP